MELKFEKVFERDIDLLIMNKFSNDSNFRNFFLSKIGLNNYDVVQIEHSLMDQDGESDITIILKNDFEKIALLIEDKIDAIAMPNQRKRYDIRGNKGIQNKTYDRFFVFIIAPEDYLKTNEESKKYENRISYEKLKVQLKDDLYAVGLLEQAIQEKKTGYVVIENEMVTNFWSRYYKYIRDFYPRLKINELSSPRGDRASWPHITTPVKKVYIIHKSDRGFMDLTFSRLGDNYNVFMENVKHLLKPNMSVHKTGKSMAIRLNVPCIDFKGSFDDYLQEMKVCLDSAMELLDLLEQIDMNKLYQNL